MYKLVTDKAQEICPGDDGFIWALGQVLPTLDERARELYEAEADVAFSVAVKSGFTATSDDIEEAIASSGLEATERVRLPESLRARGSQP